MRRHTTRLIFLILLILVVIGVGIKLFINPADKIPALSFSTYNYSDSEMYTQASAGSIGNVSNLEINWISGNVDVISYNGTEVKFEETSAKEIPSNERMCYWLDGNTLRIQFTSEGMHSPVNYGKSLTVYIPQSAELRTIEIDVVSADVNINGLNAQKTELETVSGNCHVSSLNTVDFGFDTVSGNLLADNTGFISFEGESTSGEIIINLATTFKTQEIEVDSISGDIELSLPAQFGFELEYDTISGDLTSSVEAIMISGKRLKHGDGFLKIELDTVSGNVNLIKEL